MNLAAGGVDEALDTMAAKGLLIGDPSSLPHTPCMISNVPW
jgi:hypothetical protein